ncbi:MAG: hypothetical protein R3B96_12435 [Pirellulaceae bacterium]|nr:hypothetical protein [Planctomycetales bacterium]
MPRSNLSNSSALPSGSFRRGDVAWLSREDELPKVCVVTGEPASRQLKCLFHFRETPFHSGALPIDTILQGIIYYVRDVPKAAIRLPISAEVVFRRRIGWSLTALLVLVAIGTCAGLYFGQLAINDLPKGPDRSWLNDLGIPLLAVGGFATIAVLLLVITKIMPMPTGSFEVQAITAQHVALRGLAQEFLAELPEAPVDQPPNA